MSKMQPGSEQPPPPGFAPPPPYSAAPPPQQPAFTPIHPQGSQQPTVIVVQNSFGPNRQAMTCPYCQTTMVTHVETRPTAMTHLAFLMCFIFICWPCAPFVYCTDSCLSKKHYCSNCDRYLGQYDG